jgi:DMSO/TMAO reductase YedYZ molybdopterin-dependent catalytic subunit
MSDSISRRKVITSGIAAAAGVSGLAVAARVASHYGLIPPDSGGIWGVGETLTYATQRLLMAHHSLARDWRLKIDGMVARPSSFSLDELKRFPFRSQITHHACEEGWSFIAEWSGVPLSYFLNLVEVSPQAKFVVCFPFDDSWDSLDLPDAYHPQTFLAYNLNGQDLPTPHGAPLRVRVARQLGYKSVKYLSHITVTDNLKNIGTGLGSSSPEYGYSWYAGI